MRVIRLLLPLVFVAAPLAAQKAPPRLEIGLDASYWQLDRGTASVNPTTRPTSTMRAAVVIPSRLPATFGLSASYAGEDVNEPGLLAFSSEYAQRLFPDSPDGLNLFLAVGAGMLRFIREEEEEEGEPCLPDAGCIDESIDYDDEGWRTVLLGTLGADLQLFRGVILQPTVGVARPFGGQEGSGGREPMWRLGVGLAVRP